MAIAIGTSHGAYKFTRPPTGDILAINRIKRSTPNTRYTLGDAWIEFGTSSWLAVINEFGGEIPETYGVPVEEIQEGIKHGVRKINIDTDLRLASTGAIRRYLVKNPSEFDPRKYLEEAKKAMSDIVKARYEALAVRDKHQK